MGDERGEEERGEEKGGKVKWVSPVTLLLRPATFFYTLGWPVFPLKIALKRKEEKKEEKRHAKGDKREKERGRNMKRRRRNISQKKLNKKRRRFEGGTLNKDQGKVRVIGYIFKEYKTLTHDRL